MLSILKEKTIFFKTNFFNYKIIMTFEELFSQLSL